MAIVKNIPIFFYQQIKLFKIICFFAVVVKRQASSSELFEDCLKVKLFSFCSAFFVAFDDQQGILSLFFLRGRSPSPGHPRGNHISEFKTCAWAPCSEGRVGGYLRVILPLLVAPLAVAAYKPDRTLATRDVYAHIVHHELSLLGVGKDLRKGRQTTRKLRSLQQKMLGGRSLGYGPVRPNGLSSRRRRSVSRTIMHAGRESVGEVYNRQPLVKRDACRGKGVEGGGNGGKNE